MAHIKSAESGAKVVGTGRLHFYIAPHPACKQSGVFVIPNDRVDRYGEYGGFTAVLFIARNGNQVQGWVKSDRLQATGEGVGRAEPLL